MAKDYSALDGQFDPNTSIIFIIIIMSLLTSVAQSSFMNNRYNVHENAKLLSVTVCFHFSTSTICYLSISHNYISHCILKLPIHDLKPHCKSYWPYVFAGMVHRCIKEWFFIVPSWCYCTNL